MKLALLQKQRRCKLLLLILAILPLSNLAAFDFGLILNQYAGFGSENGFEYKAGIVPRFSVLVGDTGSFFVSASMTVGYGGGLYYYPELLRTEYSARFGSLGISAGRMNYSDPLSMVANGLFDGVQLSYSSTAGRFGFGAWYTGLLFKKSANITMTEEDRTSYGAELSYGDFFNTYFAPGRLLASVDWEHPSLGELMRLRTSITAQIDLTGSIEKIHSQYLTVKMSMPLNNIVIEAGGSVEAMQTSSAFSLAFAGEIGGIYTLPTDFSSRLSLNVMYTGGKMNELINTFIPVTTSYFGEIFQVKMTGLTIASFNYSARISRELGTSVTASYFIRNDLVTENSFSADNDSYLLGGEIFARFVWSPFSDLQFNLGGGVFLPFLGNIWPDGNLQWRVDLSIVLSLY